MVYSRKFSDRNIDPKKTIQTEKEPVPRKYEGGLYVVLQLQTEQADESSETT